MANATDDTPATPRGRKRDPSRDAAILDATLDVLADAGYEGMTMDMVATRAGAGKATVYRRWASKPDLVSDAIAHLGGNEVDLGDLPDTGTLRGDILGLIRPGAAKEQERKLQVMAGLSTVMLNDPALARTVYAAVVGPWVRVNELMMRRALERGELPADTDIEVLSHVLPSMIAFRSIMERHPVDDDGAYIETLVDTVLLPAIRGSARD